MEGESVIKTASPADKWHCRGDKSVAYTGEFFLVPRELECSMSGYTAGVAERLVSCAASYRVSPSFVGAHLTACQLQRWWLQRCCFRRMYPGATVLDASCLQSAAVASGHYVRSLRWSASCRRRCIANDGAHPMSPIPLPGTCVSRFRSRIARPLLAYVVYAAPVKLGAERTSHPDCARRIYW